MADRSDIDTIRALIADLEDGIGVKRVVQQPTTDRMHHALDRLAASLAEKDAQIKRLTTALESIIVRCEEGSKKTDWLPTIASIARAALGVTDEGNDH